MQPPAPTSTPGRLPDRSAVEPAPKPVERTIHRLVRDDGIFVLTFDRPASSANVFDARTLRELAEELDFLERASNIRGLVLVSAKKSVFIAGADLHAMSSVASLDEVRGLIERGQTLMSRITALPFPTVAAIHGAALGGGYEIALACDYRIASPDRATQIGLPETQLGLIPAWGGSTRLPRLIGLPKALGIILAGKTVPAKHALKLGMIDELAPAENLIEAAVRVIRRGMPERRRHWLWNNPLTATIISTRLERQMVDKTRGHYPAVFTALEVVIRGISRSVAGSLELERDGILHLVQSEAAHNLIRVFFLQERAKKISVPGVAAAEQKPVKRAAVIGGGVMGSGIAQWLSSRQLPVILRDINAERVAASLAGISKLYADGVKRRLFTAVEARSGLDRIQPAASEVPLRNVDLVIEAAVEKLELKKQIFQRLDALVGADTILATNTSALPISELAASTHRPGRVVGLHFFNPVHRMKLVEVVAAQQTAPEVLQRAVRFTQQIGKLPVIVKDRPGFLVNRILLPYLIEAGHLFEAGAEITTLDEAMLDFGMPMGPMRLLDEVGVDVGLHVAETLAAAFSDRLRVPDVLNRMTKAAFLGRKSGRGFYIHDKTKEPPVNPTVGEFVRNDSAHNLSREELSERMVLLMVNEAARCLEEEVVGDPADVDFGMIMGTGFAPFRGGPLRYADSLGAAKIVGAMNRLVDGGARHFAPCELLAAMAVSGKRFYVEGK